MPVTGGTQLPDLLDSDDFDEARCLGLHLGVLRRLARRTVTDRFAPDSEAGDR